MASRYVPPALRNKTNLSAFTDANNSSGKEADQKETISSTDSNLYSTREIGQYFWPIQSIYEANSTTLHASEALPDSLAYVLLFHEANPRWASDNTIFVKSNIDLLLPQPDTTEADAQIAPSKAIAIFEQAYRCRARTRNFQFLGWYKIVRVQCLEPKSPELVRMLEQKWSRTDRYGNLVQKARDSSGWMSSLSQKWAVVKFEKDEVAQKEKDIPIIERLEEVEVEKKQNKTVNEMLQEMRLGGGANTQVAECGTTEKNLKDDMIGKEDKTNQEGITRKED